MANSDKTTLPALPDRQVEPLSRDLIKEMAMDIGKEVAAYIERQYPEAVKATSSTFLLSVRNCTYNEIMAALETIDEKAIAERLARRKKERRQLRSLVKSVRAMRPGDKERGEAILRGEYPMEPDLCVTIKPQRTQ